MSSLRKEILELLKTDEEFRYAVAGLLGLQEIIKRLDTYAAEVAKFAAILATHTEEIKRLREDMVEGFRRHDEILLKHDEEIKKLREDMVAGFRRHDEILLKHDEEIKKLREDMVEGFNLLRRHMDALGARWGMLSEEAFRLGLLGLVEKELGLRVERWVRFDGEGYVFGYPSSIDVDVAVHDTKTILVEVKSHVGKADVFIFKRRAEFYERVEGRKPTRLIMVTPYADVESLEYAKNLQIEVYTKV
ncbi:MAG: DUF3782 domain-containing protein [Nitrososphaerales archaeon]